MTKQICKQKGISLVEILVSLAIFSIGIVGLYLSIQSMNKNLNVSMQRDVEATYANMLISQVDPYHINAQLDEGASLGYDLTDNNNKGTIALPDGRTVYYLREVRSAASTADMLEVNIYFYRNANDAASNPYRHFKRELPIANHGYQMRITNSGYVTKDNDGNIWTGLSRLRNFDLSTANDYVAGLDITTAGATQSATDAECGQYHMANATSGRLIYILPATANHEYKVELQLCEPTDAATAGSRIAEIWLNGTLTDTVDIVAQAGAANTFLTKTYNVTPTTQSGVSVIQLELRKEASSANLPVIERFRVIR